MLSRQASHALKALLALAAEPQAWQSSHQLATSPQLPQPMLEQLLLRLRRGGLLVAQRGRSGGYRLALAPRQISVAAVLASLGESPAERSMPGPANGEGSAADQVTQALARRLERARLKALAELSLDELRFDLRSAEASLGDQGGLLLG